MLKQNFYKRKEKEKSKKESIGGIENLTCQK